MSHKVLSHWTIFLSLFVLIVAVTHKWAIDDNSHMSTEALGRIEALEAGCSG